MFDVSPVNKVGVDKDFISGINLKRYQMNPIVNYKIHTSNPVISVSNMESITSLDILQSQVVFS